MAIQHIKPEGNLYLSQPCISPLCDLGRAHAIKKAADTMARYNTNTGPNPRLSMSHHNTRANIPATRVMGSTNFSGPHIIGCDFAQIR